MAKLLTIFLQYTQPVQSKHLPGFGHVACTVKGCERILVERKIYVSCGRGDSKRSKPCKQGTTKQSSGFPDILLDSQIGRAHV